MPCTKPLLKYRQQCEQIRPLFQRFGCSPSPCFFAELVALIFSFIFKAACNKNSKIRLALALFAYFLALCPLTNIPRITGPSDNPYACA